VLLPKFHSEAGRVNLYEDYFYLKGFTAPSQGVKSGNGAEEEVSGDGL